jgi:Reverse transcriptase (RNA-dependent DNA polymerase).
MKRYGNLYSKICDMNNLRLAHKNARKGKGWYKEVKMVDADEEHYLKLLQEMLINKIYKTSEYETFFKTDGLKQREIYKLPYFPDRICQWAIIQIIEPILINNLTKDTYSAIPNRGIHLAKKRLDAAIQNDVLGTQYTLKLDVKKYYPSINHDILKSKYRRIFKDDDLLWLLDEIIGSTPGDTGIPIGNYLSQYSRKLLSFSL